MKLLTMLNVEKIFLTAKTLTKKIQKTDSPESLESLRRENEELKSEIATLKAILRGRL